jgi:SnoaL-like polyketide cyclase
VSDADGFARYLAVWNGEAPVYELPSLLAPGYRGHLGSEERDVAGLAEAITAYRARLPDVRFAIDHQFGDGEYVASRVSASATHPDTGEPAHLVGINISRWLHGLLVEEWAVWETLE